MKKIIVLLFVSASCVFAQTNSASTNSPLSNPGFVNNIVNNIGVYLKDAEPFITNDVADLDSGLLYDKTLTKGKVGAFIAYDIPGTNQLALGFGGAYINNQWFDANVNLKLGTTITYPVVGKIYNYISSGPDYSFHTHSIGAYNFVGMEKAWDLGAIKFLGANHLSLRATVGVGNISTLPGTVWELGVGLSKGF